MSYGPKFLRTYNWLHVPVANGRELVTIAGVVEIDYKGGSPSGQWKRGRIELVIPFPAHILPQHNVFYVECVAPLVTINAIYNQGHAVNAGWAVDRFGLLLPQDRKIEQDFTVWADVGVNDVDGYLYRVGFTVTLSGFFTEKPQPPQPDWWSEPEPEPGPEPDSEP